MTEIFPLSHLIKGSQGAIKAKVAAKSSGCFGNRQSLRLFLINGFSLFSLKIGNVLRPEGGTRGAAGRTSASAPLSGGGDGGGGRVQRLFSSATLIVPLEDNTLSA